jgi:hypothetical protein
VKENQVVDNAKYNFERLTLWTLKVQKSTRSEVFDGIAEIKNKQNKLRLVAEIKNEIKNTDIIAILNLKKQSETFLIIAQYIPKPIRERFKAENINYIESSGNCFISTNGIFIYIDNQKAQPQRVSSKNKMYTEGGMRFIYACFLHPELLNASFRVIANETELALGSVGPILEGLADENFIQLRATARILVDKPRLFETWINHFGSTMRAHLFQRRFAFINQEARNNWQNMTLENAFWGGEPAAYMLDNYLFPESFTLYSNLSLHELMVRYKLVPDVKGDVLWMLPPFTHQRLPKLADEYLVCAELMQSSDSRCLEAAQRIKEKYIDPKIRNI